MIGGTSLEKKRKAQAEMRERLERLPQAKGFLMSYDAALIQACEEVTSKLWRFVRFLSKLDFKQYIRWMHQAFASFTPSDSAHPSPDIEQKAQTNVETEKSVISPRVEDKPSRKALFRKGKS